MHTADFSRFDFQVDDFLLDLGCGEGRHSLGAAWLFKHIRILALDMSDKDLRTAQSRQNDQDSQSPVAFLRADGCRLPLADQSVDHLICSEVLEHIPNYTAMLSEIDRVLKPGGKLCVSVPRAWPEAICWRLSREYHEVEGGHVRIFSAKNLQREIVELGYQLEAHHGAHALHVPYWWLRCAFWSKGERFWLVKWYHRLLVWDLLKKPLLTRTLDRALNPIMGKSVVFYFVKR